MNYKPDEGTLVAYLYGELDRDEKEKVERYLAAAPEARNELEQLRLVRKVMGALEDKEVIAPPIVIDGNRPRLYWNHTAVKVILSVAASLLLLMVVGKLTGARMSVSDREFRISFGEAPAQPVVQPEPAPVLPLTASLTEEEVRQMIDASLAHNNKTLQADWHVDRQKLDASISRNLAANSEKIDQLVRETSVATQEQVGNYVASIQAQNMEMVKDYLQLTATEQKQYIEDLLVDFAKYLQQQRNDDLVIMQARLNNIEQNTDYFKQETEQILSSIISHTNTTIKN